MCDHCNQERDEDYDEDSIEDKRRKAIASIVTRHPELGVRPEDITYRFVPKHKSQCVRINLTAETPRYEIHIRESMGQAMKSGPSLQGVAVAACIETGKPFEETCEILATSPHTRLEAPA